MNKTKVIVTLVHDIDYEVIKSLIIHGTDVFRLNLKYNTFDTCVDLIKKINKCNEELKTYTGIMLDTKGIIVKTNKFNNGYSNYTKDDIIRIYMDNINGDSTKLSVDYPDLINDINNNEIIIINEVKLEVIEKKEDCILCKVINGGIIYDDSILNMPTTRLNIPVINNELYKTIDFACNKIDYLAISDIRSGEDILQVSDKLINLKNDHIKLIAKIENLDAIEDMDNIVNVSDGILLVKDNKNSEIPIERMPGIQKRIINKCQTDGKISIISTDLTIDNNQTLSSQVSDIANAVLDGVDSVILSVTDNLVGCLDNIEKIIKQAEIDTDYLKLKNIALRTENNDITGVIANSVADIAYQLKCKSILAPTKSGYTAIKISRFRPICPILAVSPDIETVKSLNLYYGVTPVLINELGTLDSIIKIGEKELKNKIELKDKDKIIITGGYPFKETKHTNFIKIEEI